MPIKKIHSFMMSETFVDAGLLVLRLGFAGIMLFAHGLPKLSGFAEISDKFPDPLGIGSPMSLTFAVMGEFFASIAICIGLFTRYAAIPFAITMVVAAFIHHGADPFKQQEKAILFLIASIAIILAGPGKYSVDAKMK